MAKKYRVVLNNDSVTVVNVDGQEVQFPSIHRDAKWVYVETDNGYSIVDELTENDNTAEESADEEKVSKKKRTKKTTVEEETIVEDIN